MSNLFEIFLAIRCCCSDWFSFYVTLYVAIYWTFFSKKEKKLKIYASLFVTTLISELHLCNWNLEAFSVVRKPYLNVFSLCHFSVYLCRSSYIFTPTRNSKTQEKANVEWFKTIDSASSYFRLQVEEVIHINQKKRELNKKARRHYYYYIGLLFIILLVFLFLLIFLCCFFLYTLRLYTRFTF